MTRATRGRARQAREGMATIVLAVLADNEPPASLRKPLIRCWGKRPAQASSWPQGRSSACGNVSHHPPVSAHCTEGANVRVEGQLLPRPHLVGAHIEVELVGSARITLLDAEDEVYEYDLPAFEWRFVPRWEARMKCRTKWRVACERTGYIAEYAYGSKRTVRGHIFNAEGVAECDIYGRYDGRIVVARSTSGDVIARYDLNDPTAFKGNIVRHTRLDDARDTEVVWRECFRAAVGIRDGTADAPSERWRSANGAQDASGNFAEKCSCLDFSNACPDRRPRDGDGISSARPSRVSLELQDYNTVYERANALATSDNSNSNLFFIH